MRLADLSPEEGRSRLRNAGLCWQVGPYAIRAKTDLPEVAEGLRFLYSAFPVLSSEIVDAELSIRSKPLLSRWVSIEVDGEVHYDWLPRRLAMPMAEWALNVCVFQRSHQFFMMHAAVVERDGRAAVLSGSAGSGKSTLCAALVHRGWRLLSDEVAPIRPVDGLIQPVPRPVSLKERSIDVIESWAPRAVLGPRWPRTSKGTVAHMLPPDDSVARAGDTARPSWLFFPRFDDRESTEIRPVPKARAFMRAADNSFNYSVLGRRAFDTLGAFIDASECFDLRFNGLEEAVRQFTSVTTGARGH